MSGKGFVPKGGRPVGQGVIIPAHLMNRFQDLRAFVYEAKTPDQAMEMVTTVMQECGEAVDAYEWHAIEPLVLPALQAAFDGLLSVEKHLQATGQDELARKKALAIRYAIKDMMDAGVEGTFQIPGSEPS